MVLAPGVVMTTAIRDMLSGELVSGVTRGGAEALAIAVAIATGVAVVLSMGGADSMVVQMIAGFVSAAAFAYIYHVPPAQIARSGGFVGGTGWSIFLVVRLRWGVKSAACFGGHRGGSNQ